MPVIPSTLRLVTAYVAIPHIAAKDAFRKLDSYLWETTWRWGKRRHSNKGHKWVVDKYWTSEGTRNWIFETKESRLLKFSDTKIRRHSYA